MNLSSSEIEHLLTTSDPQAVDDLFARAAAERDRVYGRRVFMRGLIAISNHCQNDCLYCGIRDNKPYLIMLENVSSTFRVV